MHHSRQFMYTASFTPSVVATVLASLRIMRAHPELVGELAQHESLIATQFTNVDLVESQIAELEHAIAHLR